MYCRITLSTLQASQPESLPERFIGLTDEVLADPARILDPVPDGLQDAAFWPADIATPDVDPTRETLTGTYALEVDKDAKRVKATAEKRDLTDEEKADLPAPQYQVLGKGDFLDLVLSTGVTLDEIRAAADDPQMANFWFVLREFYSQIRRDHEFTKRGLDGMVALGHITREQADKAMDTWPRLPS